jgi:hypothetical protein
MGDDEDMDEDEYEEYGWESGKNWNGEEG